MPLANTWFLLFVDLALCILIPGERTLAGPAAAICQAQGQSEGKSEANAEHSAGPSAWPRHLQDGAV